MQAVPDYLMQFKINIKNNVCPKLVNCDSKKKTISYPPPPAKQSMRKPCFSLNYDFTKLNLISLVELNST